MLQRSPLNSPSASQSSAQCSTSLISSKGHIEPGGGLCLLLLESTYASGRTPELMESLTNDRTVRLLYCECPVDLHSMSPNFQALESHAPGRMRRPLSRIYFWNVHRRWVYQHIREGDRFQLTTFPQLGEPRPISYLPCIRWPLSTAFESSSG